MGLPGIHGGHGCVGHVASVGGDMSLRTEAEDEVLSGIDFGALWLDTRTDTKGNDAVLSAFALCGSKTLFLLDLRELS